MKFWKRALCLGLGALLAASALPVAAGALSEEDLTAPSAVLMEASTGKVLFEKNSHEVRACASITKVMTLLLVMEAIDQGRMSLTDTITASEHASSMGGSDIWLEPGETMSADDMVKATVVASANDAAVALAEHLEGTEEAFVQKMNQRAAELGMKDTVFKNCNGLDEEGHVTSAYDVALMSRELIKHEKIFDYTTIWMDTLREGKTQIVNTNKLLKSYNGITGLKTGTTGGAGSCITATAQRDGLSLIGVVLGSVGSAAGRLLMPMLSDKIGRRPTDLLLFAVSLGLSAGFAFAQGWWVIACYAGLTFCYSGLAAVLPALSTDLFGLPHAGVNYGFLALGQSVGSLAFPFAANLWGLEAGRHWLAVGGAAAGFAAMWVLKPAGQTPRRQDTGA